MLDRLIALFRAAPANEVRLPPADAMHALGVLLLRVAHADRAFLWEEVAAIDRLLERRFALNPVEAMKLRAACAKLDEALPATETLAEVLVQSTTPDEREETALALWRVALSDGHRDGREVKTIATIANLLQIDPATQASVREKAELENPPSFGE